MSLCPSVTTMDCAHMNGWTKLQNQACSKLEVLVSSRSRALRCWFTRALYVPVRMFLSTLFSVYIGWLHKNIKLYSSIYLAEVYRLWARRGFHPPGGIFYTIFFWNPNVSWAFFTCSAIWQLGRLWVIEVKGHQVHLSMWSISWSAINDYLVNLSQCVSPKWSQMV